ncbi:sensor histidine kinase [Microbacterium sp. SA39]|uniref:sensor histidine kinase n=1 Tax=Microbacterium sp. SA39 TaxID=1263625 RepID=UPI0005FA31B3|nr:histidine kinase [Microbacterium sp. SA39]
MSRPERPSPRAERVRRAIPPVLVLAAAIGYLGADLWIEELPATVPGDVPPWAYAGLIALQALLLVFRRRAPITVFAGAVLLDAVILATSAGELGAGSLGVILAAYGMARRSPRTPALTALGIGALVTTVVGGGALLFGSRESLFVLLLTVIARIALQYAAPAAVAEYVRGRERLADALQEQARMAEHERRERAEREVRAEREALARELHDIAGHHLSGIIVSAQAATALTRSDLDRAREMMQTVQDDARIALADLRRTVGLLRSDDAPSGGPSPVPAIAGIGALVAVARERGQRVALTQVGDARPVGALAETTAYRMVQESLANAARHAPGAACAVTVRFGADAVEITVSNEPSAEGAAPATRSGVGYGLSGMAERAELIGAKLTVGPDDRGGWTNRLRIPFDGRSAA